MHSPGLEGYRRATRAVARASSLRWSAATLGGHNGPAVAQTVRAFLDGLPADYPPRLRNILLQSADELFRAAAIAG